MSPWTKLLIGLAAALSAGWINHGPLGRGAAFLDLLQARSELVIRVAELSQVTVRFPRDVAARRAILSGPADDFQRQGQGSLPGLNQRVRTVPGVSGVQWTDEPRRGSPMPLLLEIELMVLLAFLAGLGLGWIFFRPRREGFL